MADKGQPIVIKKINITVGAHGGGWKVAFADFMTAMMAFFLVMWLLNQSEDVKKQVASYFSGPSMLEHQFTSYGAELTLEKLFLDMINEPLGTLQKLMQPADFTPNVLAMGSKRVIMHHIANELGTVADNVSINSDTIEFEIKDIFLFEVGTARLSGQFIDVMEKVRAITAGLEDSIVDTNSLIYVETTKGSKKKADQIAAQRLEIVKRYIEESLENESVEVAKGSFKSSRDFTKQVAMPPGKITFKVIQKENLSDGRKPRKINELFGERDTDMTVYNSFVKQLSKKKKKSRSPDSVKRAKKFKKKYQ